MSGPDDIRDMRPESPMPRPERSACFACSADAWEAAAVLLEAGTPSDAVARIARRNAEKLRAMRPEDQP